MSEPVEEHLARQACFTCKRQKRKCTRELPSCQLCNKSRRQCEYPAEALEGIAESLVHGAEISPVSSSPHIWNQLTSAFRVDERIDELPSQDFRRDPSKTLFFLDSYMFEHTKATIQNPLVVLSPEFARHLQDEEQGHHVAQTYFSLVHPLFPIGCPLFFSTHIWLSTSGSPPF